MAARAEPVLVAARIVAVRQEYKLTIDHREAAALGAILKDCTEEEVAPSLRKDYDRKR